MQIRTGDASIDAACELAVRTLRMNVSEKWGRLCPVLAPAWGEHYPAWIHPFDNFWMNKVTPYIYPKDQVEWPVLLFSMYQNPIGMIGWGVHDCDSPESTQAKYAEMGLNQARSLSAASRYVRDHLYIMQVHDLWWHYGDLELARRLFPSCTKSLGYLYEVKDNDWDGLIETADIIEDIDVGSMESRTGACAAERFVEQAMLYGALVHYVKLAEALGDAHQLELASSLAAALATKVNELFWNDAGYYIFALDAKSHQPLHDGVTSTYGNGYGVLWGLVPPQRIGPVLDYLTGWDFDVPGPVLVPPLELPLSVADRDANLSPGVYANGGCGWGRGHMPSVCLACFKHGREETAISYIRKMAAAANSADAFYEYWTWGKYTGSSDPGGCREYSETASAFLDSVIHGYFGLEALEPGWKSLRFAPKPITGMDCSITLQLPGGALVAELQRREGRWETHLRSGVDRRVEVVLPGREPVQTVVSAAEVG